MLKELLSIKRLTHDPTTECQRGLKLFRLILNEVDTFLQSYFSNNMSKVINENNSKRLLDIKKPNAQEKIIIGQNAMTKHFVFYLIFYSWVKF